jgi:hypothetical protein
MTIALVLVMAEQIHQFANEIAGADGTRYAVRAVAEKRGNVWIGWLEFQPAGRGRALKTGEETSQPNKEAVAYWATGLEAVYLDGALVRAR